MACSIGAGGAPVPKVNLEDTVCQAYGRRLHSRFARPSKPAARHFGRCRWQGSGAERTWVKVARAEPGFKGCVTQSDVNEQPPRFDTTRTAFPGSSNPFRMATKK